MVAAEFSETSFSFAFTRDLLNKLNPGGQIAPYFPTTIDEANQGYDVGVSIRGQLLFFQYKIPEEITTYNGSYSNDFGVPYFTVRIRRSRRNRPTQHDVLKRLAVSQPNVFYAMPAFARTEDLNRAFSQNNVINRSIWIAVSELGPFGFQGGPHQIVYRSSRYYRWHSSDHESENAKSAEEWISGIMTAIASQDSSRIDNASVHNLLNLIQGLVGPFDQSPQINLSSDPDLATSIKALGYVTRMYLDTDLVVVADKESVIQQ